MTEARIYSHTVIRTPSAEFADLAPYCVAVLELADGRRVCARVEGYRDGMPVAIGDPVRHVPGSEGREDTFSFIGD